MDIPEHIRANIEKMLNEALKEAKPNLQVDPVLMHMITQMCFVMHRSGIKDAFNAIRRTLDELEKSMTK